MESRAAIGPFARSPSGSRRGSRFRQVGRNCGADRTSGCYDRM